jgi:hypothetical protein
MKAQIRTHRIRVGVRQESAQPAHRRMSRNSWHLSLLRRARAARRGNRRPMVRWEPLSRFRQNATVTLCRASQEGGDSGRSLAEGGYRPRPHSDAIDTLRASRESVTPATFSY